MPLREICKKAMSARADERYVTAQHMADDLEKFSSIAVVKAYEKPATRVAVAALGFGLLATVTGLQGIVRVATWKFVAPQSLGIGLVFLIASLALAWFEWRSRGRLGLAHLGYGMAAACFLTGWIGVGFAIFRQGTWEDVVKIAGTSLAIDSLFAAAALAVWGIVMRQRDR